MSMYRCGRRQPHGFLLALDWAGPRPHRAAIAALLAGELFLGRYAGNYFAKELLPDDRHMDRLAQPGMEASRVCLHCWHRDRTLHLEDEAHMVFECALYEKQRQDLWTDLTARTCQIHRSGATSQIKLATLLSSQSRQDLAALGRFLARCRQLRRKISESGTDDVVPVSTHVSLREDAIGSSCADMAFSLTSCA
jgi:hypothetical protein